MSETPNKTMKAEIEEKINRLEARLSASTTTVRNIQNTLQDAGEAISKLDLLYKHGTTKQKREIVSSIFPEKLVLDESGSRTQKVNEAVELIDLINNKLKHKKRELNDLKSFNSLGVHL